MIRVPGPVQTLALAFPLLLALATPAHADNRLVQVSYDPARVVRIEGTPTVQATIMFADSEMIENVAIGDSAAWQVTPNKRANVLFVKPLAVRASTNMTVITNKRSYLFDLVASPAAKPLYVLRFAYPPEPEGKVPAAGAGAMAASGAPTEAAPATMDPLDLNFAWSASGNAALLPSRTFDDGLSTYLSWPAGAQVPAILVTNPDGVEGPVNFSVRGDTVVIDGVPQAIVLRSGKKSATLVNAAPPAADPQSRSASQHALASAQETK